MGHNWQHFGMRAPLEAEVAMMPANHQTSSLNYILRMVCA